jgi:hypothetical protein
MKAQEALRIVFDSERKRLFEEQAKIRVQTEEDNPFLEQDRIGTFNRIQELAIIEDKLNKLGIKF